MKMLKSMVMGALLLVAACATPGTSQAQLQQAKGVSYGLENAYVAALQTATVWADKSNRCGPNYPIQPPLCSTAKGVIDVEAKRLVAKSALTRLDTVIADVTATPDAIASAISVATNAVKAYQDITKGVSP